MASRDIRPCEEEEKVKLLARKLLMCEIPADISKSGNFVRNLSSFGNLRSLSGNNIALREVKFLRSVHPHNIFAPLLYLAV